MQLPILALVPDAGANHDRQMLGHEQLAVAPTAGRIGELVGVSVGKGRGAALTVDAQITLGDRNADAEADR